MKDNVKELNELRIKLDLLDIPHMYDPTTNTILSQELYWKIKVGDIYYEVMKYSKRYTYLKAHYSCDQFLKELMKAGNYYE